MPLSAGAGWFGMDVATKSNVVTVEAADQSINEGLRMAFKSGSIMGFSVTGFGITGLSIIYWIYRAALQDPKRLMFGNIFQDSASELPVSHYLHVWVVVYTRKPPMWVLTWSVKSKLTYQKITQTTQPLLLTMLAITLVMSLVWALICSSLTLARSLPHVPLPHNNSTNQLELSDLQRSAIALPFWISGFGIVCSMVGTRLVKTDTSVEKVADDASSEVKFEAANKTLNALLAFHQQRYQRCSCFLVVCFSALCCFLLFKDTSMALRIFFAIIIGLFAGILIGEFTEYCTSYTESPTQGIAKKGETGPATVIIQGLGVGMIGTAVPTAISLSLPSVHVTRL